MIPSILATLSSRWGLVELGEPFPGERASYVAPAVDREGRSLVVKVFPNAQWAESEYRALAHWDGRGSVRALRFDGQLGAILEERADPGGNIEDAVVDDVEATRIFADVAGLGALWPAQLVDGSYGMRDSRRYSGPFRCSTRLQSRSGLSVNTSSSRAGSTIQLSVAISASS